MIDKEKNKRIRNIIIFIVVVLLSGWIGVFVDTFIAGQLQGNSLGMAIWLILPLMTSLLLRAFAGDGWDDIGFMPRFKGNIKWYIISFIIFPIVTFVVIVIGDVTGWIDVSALNVQAFSAVFVGGFSFQFIKNFFEESVWRGYLTSKLLKLGIKDFWLYIITGGVWSCWHMAYYLVFLPLSDIQSILAVDRLSFFFIGIVTMTCWTVMYTEIYRLTKSIWPLVILHMVEDSLINPIILGGYIKITQGKEIFISPIVGIITTMLYLAVGLGIRKYRLKQTVPETNKITKIDIRRAND